MPGFGGSKSGHAWDRLPLCSGPSLGHESNKKDHGTCIHCPPPLSTNTEHPSRKPACEGEAQGQDTGGLGFPVRGHVTCRLTVTMWPVFSGTGLLIYETIVPCVPEGGGHGREVSAPLKSMPLRGTSMGGRTGRWLKLLHLGNASSPKCHRRQILPLLSSPPMDINFSDRERKKSL